MTNAKFEPKKSRYSPHTFHTKKERTKENKTKNKLKFINTAIQIQLSSVNPHIRKFYSGEESHQQKRDKTRQNKNRDTKKEKDLDSGSLV